MKLDKLIMVTNYMLMNFVLTSLIEDHKELEVAGEMHRGCFPKPNSL